MRSSALSRTEGGKPDAVVLEYEYNISPVSGTQFGAAVRICVPALSGALLAVRELAVLGRI
jgi:hypothetical protein